MRRLLILLLASVAAAAAQAPQKLQGWSYHCDCRYLSDQYADKTGHRLSDGDASLKSPVIYQGNPIAIEVDLGRPARVSSVAALVSRPNDNYKVRNLRVEAKLAGHYQQVASVAGFWGPTQQRDFRLEAKGLDAVTDGLRLVFEGADILCISQIEIAGQPQEPAADASGIHLAPRSDPRPSAREEDVDGDGKREVILENDQVRLIFRQTGGLCCSLLYKPANAELVAPESQQYGLLRDDLWSPAYSFAGRPYTWRTGGDAQSAWVELSASGVGGMMSFTNISKRVRITQGSPVVQVHYRLLNDPSSQTDYTYGWWFHNFLGIPGADNHYFDPTEEGVKEYDFNPRTAKGGSEVWYRNPARGWTAVAGPGGAGLAATMEYQYLNCFYHWSGIGCPAATHEWRFNRIPLKSGQALETDLTLMPFQGLSRVDGVVEDVLGSIALAPDEKAPTAATVRLQLASPQSKPAAGVIRLRALPDGAWRDLGRLAVAPGKPAEQRVDLAGLAPGSYLLACGIERGGAALDDIERPFAVGGARLAYHREPAGKRVGLAAEEAPALPRHDLSDAVVTPHIPWARPLPGGPIKALVLCDDTMAREIIELRERLDLDFTYVKFRTTIWKEELYTGDRSISTIEQARARLLEYLKANRYQLFLLSGFDWNRHFTPEIRDAITQQVRDGAGLVFVEPDGFQENDPLAPMMGIAKGRNMNAWAAWKPGPPSPLTAGLPWGLFPKTRFMDYSRPPQGEVLATLSNGKPLLVTNSFGKGRTAVLTYDTLTHDNDYRGYAALTPILSYRGGWLLPEFKDLTWRYWEGYYAWLARLATWAAGRDSGVQVASLEPLDLTAGPADALPLKLAGVRAPCKVQAEFENRWGQPLGRREVAVAAGQEDVRIPLPADLGAGVNLAGVVVRDAAGASLAWGQTYIRAGAPVAVKSIQPDRDIVLGERSPRAGQPYDRAFRPSDAFRVLVKLDARWPAAQGHTIRARLYDTHHRLLFEETRPLPAGAEEMTFEARPAELRSMGLEWEVAALGPRGQSDVAYQKVICPWPRDWDRFRLSNWGGIYPWRSEYLYPYLAPLVEDVNDVAFHGTSELATGHVWRHYWYNMDWGFLGLLDYLPGIPDFRDAQFAEKSAKFNQTGDKQYLVRTPSLSDPKWCDAVARHIRASAGTAMKFGGAYDYCMGDEMSLTYYTRYFDYDWAPESLAGFRKWLQARYPDLGALNRAWDTQFATWDAVLPMTLDEVKSRANAAPWCEFRDYMNDVLAGFYAGILHDLKSVDPKARAGLSGTQEPRAGNGMDWWKDSLAFNYYHSYNTGWSNEMRRSFAPYTGVQQSPYYAGYWQAGRTIEYNMFWCLLHDTNGVSAWATPLFFYNDFTYSESGRDTRALCKEMKHGIWDLIRSARRQQDGIAIHYSQDSINASQLLGKEEEIVKVRDAWVKLLEDLGLQYNFVATPQIEDGILAKERYRVLVLPESFAISDKEKAAIEAFAQAGGTVIADRGAGLLDGKCRRQPQGMLDALFGIRRGTGAAAGTPGVSVKLGKLDLPDLKLPAAEALSPAGATACGKARDEGAAPVLFRRPAGKGAAWYLNLDLIPYDSERTLHTPAEQGIRSLLQAVLADAGVRPPVPVRLASGKPAHVEVVRYSAGDLTYLGLLSPRGGGEELATAALPAPAYVYDCRIGESLGKLKEVRAALDGGQAQVYCLSPQPLAAPALSLAGRSLRPGEELRWTAGLKGGADSRKQLVRLTVYRPDGSEYDDYSRNLLLGAGRLSGSLRLALNDPKGAWRVVARDLCTGAKAEVRFTVR